MHKTKKMTTAALLAALCVVLMLGACTLPIGSFVLLVAAAMLPVAAVLRCGFVWGILCYAAAAVLTLLLFPGRLKGLAFAVVLGHYGLCKYLIERLRKLPLEWVCKLAVWNGSLALCWWLYTSVFAAQTELPLSLLALWLLSNAAFIVYDIGMTMLIGWFQQRFPG